MLAAFFALSVLAPQAAQATDVRSRAVDVNPAPQGELQRSEPQAPSPIAEATKSAVGAGIGAAAAVALSAAFVVGTSTTVAGNLFHPFTITGLLISGPIVGALLVPAVLNFELTPSTIVGGAAAPIGAIVGTIVFGGVVLGGGAVGLIESRDTLLIGGGAAFVGAVFGATLFAGSATFATASWFPSNGQE